MSCSPCTRMYLGQVHVQPHDAPREATAGVKGHHPDIASLCRAALSGCRICIDLWRNFFKEKRPEEYAEDPCFQGQLTTQLYLHSGTSYRFLEPGPSMIGEAPRPNSLILEFNLNSTMIKDVERKKFVFEKVDPHERLLNYSGNFILSPTNSGFMNMMKITPKAIETTRWNRVQTWINTCSSSHSICQLRCSSPKFFPTRVIYIPFGPVAPKARYHLIDTRTQSPTSLGLKYVTLSHCWGTPKNPPYRTSAQNVAERLSVGISRDDLPPTFRDAIDTALRLGVPFLWIDSLCIIQGDKDDWAVECTKMAHVYMNSYLNISATSASSSHDGLSSSYEMHPRIVNTGWLNGRAGTYRLIDPDFWRERVTDAQVNTRGWVLQERILAPRVLHFAFDQLLWECCELSASEEFPEGMPTDFIRDYVRDQVDFKQTTNLSLPPSQLAYIHDPAESNYRKFHGIWQRLATMYGRLELTQPDTDKFMAISGLARVIQRELNDQYLAGLWKKNLVGDLLWRVHKTQRKIHGTVPHGCYERRWDYSKRAVTYRAPSWSWASVDGLVRLGDYLDLSGKSESIKQADSTFTMTTFPMASILDVSSSLVKPEDEFGQVDGGKLKVWGQMHRLGTTMAFREPITIFRTTSERVFSHLDEPISWNLYEQAYFLPLVITEKRFTKLPQSIVDMNKRIKDGKLSLNSSYIHTESKNTKDGETLDFSAVDIDREDAYDLVSGIELCPTQDGKAFRRISCIEVPVQRFRRLGGCMRLEEPTSKYEFPGKDNICSPNVAAMQGNTIAGIFEIV